MIRFVAQGYAKGTVLPGAELLHALYTDLLHGLSDRSFAVLQALAFLTRTIRDQDHPRWRSLS